VDKQGWFEQARLGLFIHWGSFSVKGMEASWPLAWGEISYAGYEALAERFNPSRYNAEAWAALAQAAGARYAVLTTKHHDGLALFDTQLSDYSTARRAAGRDLVAPYVEAFRAAGLKVGFYFSLPDWHHPDYPAGISDPTPRHWRPAQALPPGAPASLAADPDRWERYLAFMHGQVRELCTHYGTIDLLWFDGQWEHTADEWRSAKLVQMVRQLQPGIVINNRLALDNPNLGDYDTPEQVVPVAPPARSWETCLTINETWGYNPKDRAYKSSRELIQTLAEVVSKGGNLLLNMGPTAEGEIPVEFESRLRVLGDWLARNGESIYGAGPGLAPGAYYGPSTGAPAALYLHVVGYPADGVIRVRGLERRATQVTLLADGAPLEFDQHGGVLEQGLLRIGLPGRSGNALTPVIKVSF
jgi:alpha-L-fucosidase